MLQPAKFTVKIKKIRKLTEDVIEMDLDMNHSGDFIAGQFATVRINDELPGVCMRSYSLLKGSGGVLQLCIKKVPSGRGTTYLFGRKEGDELEILYPLGRFVLPEVVLGSGAPLVFIATGTGIVPLLCMIESIAEGVKNELPEYKAAKNRSIKLIFGVRYEKDLFYVERINALKEALPGFEAIFTLSGGEEGWKGARGRVTEHLFVDETERAEGAQRAWASAEYFICGGAPVISSVREVLEKNGTEKEHIYFESF
jgi:ferredoxin-NADP reductase